MNEMELQIADAKRRAKVLANAYAMLDFLSDNPDATLPYGIRGTWTVYASTEQELLAQRRIMGNVEKVFTSWDVGFEKKFGDTLALRVVVARSTVCTQVQTGTQIIPASEEKEVPVYEWTCPDSLLNKLANE